MQLTCVYRSPLGDMLLAADEAGLCGAWFEGQKYFARGLDVQNRQGKTPVLDAATDWLNGYFAGENPPLTLPLNPSGTAFQQEVWAILRGIPYGQTCTYGRIAQELAARRGLTRFSAQAVGGAVGHNPLSVLIPCHRVVGRNGEMTGYAGGIQKKCALLALERSECIKNAVF